MEFRTNLFALVYAAAVASLGVDRNAVRARWEDLLPAAVLILAPLLYFERGPGTRGKKPTGGRQLPLARCQQLIGLQGAEAIPDSPETVILDQFGRICGPYRYYARYHPILLEDAR